MDLLSFPVLFVILLDGTPYAFPTLAEAKVKAQAVFAATGVIVGIERWTRS